MHILPVKYSSGHLKPLQDGQCDYRASPQLAAHTKHIEIGNQYYGSDPTRFLTLW